LGIALTNSAIAAAQTNNILFMIQGQVEVARWNSNIWTNATLRQHLYPGDRVRTGERSRAGIYLTNGMTIEKGELSDLEIPPSPNVTFRRGLFKIFNRERNKGSEFNLHGATAAIRGTDFLLHVAENGRSELTVLDGEVALVAGGVETVVGNYERGMVGPGEPPHKTAVLEAATNNLVQWSLYYPGVLNVNDLQFAEDEKQILQESLEAYRAGDLLQALARYPWRTPLETDSIRIYRAALLLTVGQVERASRDLQVAKVSPAVNALNAVITAVRFDTSAKTNSPRASSEWLAESYYQQSRSKLNEALQMAYAAVTNAPDFSFAWARVAELEFGFGRNDKALVALKHALQISPRNAQAIALRGFLSAAQNETARAILLFEQAIAIDSGLANAWLGRGLCFFRENRKAEGLRDLTIAASLESQRSILRSYLAKAFAEIRDEAHAEKELELAKQLDPNDPTPWLYSALLRHDQYRLNEAIADLEKSQELNDNRRIYRSELLLDQDRAVRSSSLASIYRDGGMKDVGLREAARAVSYDYGNYSSHLFLSESFDAFRDPTRFNLRYETVWFNELLLANLLSPVGGTPLSQNISQQEYARLFERDRIGLSSSTEYRSDGQIRELASQFGVIGNTAWSLDLDYQHNHGVRPNNELDRTEWYTTIKQQLTPHDSITLLTKFQDYHSGDNFQYYNPNDASPNFNFDEDQSPIAVAGFHHEWQPGVHTLFLGGRLENDQRFADRAATRNVLIIDDQRPVPSVIDSAKVGFDFRQQTQLEVYTAEVQQIVENERHAFLVGGRWQGGQFDTESRLWNPGPSPYSFPTPAADTRTSDDFERTSAYAYETLKLPFGVRLTGGLTYEYMRYPENFRSPPLQSGEERRERFNPKAAFVWDLSPEATVRGVYAQSLGGVSLDESFQLEPTQLDGFVQSFRTLIPESLVGSVSAPDHEIFGGAIDLKFPTRTYVSVHLEQVTSKVRQTVGTFDAFTTDLHAEPSSTRQHLNYDEHSATLAVHQLWRNEWAASAHYSFTHSELETTFPSLASLSPELSLDSVNRAHLQRVQLSLLYNHPSGFFFKVESDWYWQHNSGDATLLRDDSFQQLNVFVGYRFPRRRADLTLGVLNATDEDYRLNPVTPYYELPRETIFFARLRFRF